MNIVELTAATQIKMNKRISGFHIVYVAIVIILISKFVDGHEKSANVNRMKRLTDNVSMQLQPHQYHPHQKSTSEPNSDQRNSNTLKDRFNNDKIVFDRGDLYQTTSTERTTSVTPMTISNNLPISNETNHQYSGKANGEYNFTLTIRNGIRRVESGEFEEHNNQRVFVVRGFFQHISKDGEVKVTAYVFDHTGYHEIPVTVDDDVYINFLGPGQAQDCDFSKGVYCIDRKLLSLMVG